MSDPHLLYPALIIVLQPDMSLCLIQIRVTFLYPASIIVLQPDMSLSPIRIRIILSYPVLCLSLLLLLSRIRGALFCPFPNPP
jgi:hypothetical protein